MLEFRGTHGPSVAFSTATPLGREPGLCTSRRSAAAGFRPARRFPTASTARRAGATGAQPRRQVGHTRCTRSRRGFSSAVSSCLGSRPACSHAEEPAQSGNYPDHKDFRPLRSWNFGLAAGCRLCRRNPYVEPGTPAWRAPPGYAGAGYPFRNHCAGCDTLNQLRSSEKIAVSSTFSSRLLTITGATGHATVPMTGRLSEKNCQTSAR